LESNLTGSGRKTGDVSSIKFSKITENSLPNAPNTSNNPTNMKLGQIHNLIYDQSDSTDNQSQYFMLNNFMRKEQTTNLKESYSQNYP
jgi:hypothetical protein